MGFSGGGSGVLLNHEHDGTLALDGGPLNFLNITQSGQGQGDITYSDGNHLQTLTYPGVPGGEQLTAVAATTEPSWVVPPVVGVPNTILLDAHTAVGSETDYTVDFTADPKTFADFSYFFVIFYLTPNSSLTNVSTVLNGAVGTTNTYTVFSYSTSAAYSYADSISQPSLHLASTVLTNGTASLSGEIKVYFGGVAGQPTGDSLRYTSFCQNNFGLAGKHENVVGVNFANNSTLTSIKIQCDVSSWAAGSTILTYGVAKN